MMVPASFDEANVVLSRPPQLTAEQCAPLCILRMQDQDNMVSCTSCWKLTKEELDEINRTGRVWLVVYGITMPPVALSGIKPFEVTGNAPP